jgi:hypothetical protein
MIAVNSFNSMLCHVTQTRQTEVNCHMRVTCHSFTGKHPRIVNMAPSVPSRKITDNLTRAAGVLQDMQAQGEKLNLRNNMPASPPALFGAGGPM